MSEGMNKVILIGNLGQDPEVRHGQSGAAILNLRMATAESWFDKDSNERKERTEWHTVVLFGKRADALGKFLRKGAKLCAEGRLQTRSWEDKSGAKRYSTEVVASNIILLSGKRESGGGGNGSPYDNNPPHEAPSAGGFGDDPGEIPF